MNRHNQNRIKMSLFSKLLITGISVPVFLFLGYLDLRNHFASDLSLEVSVEQFNELEQ